MKIEESIDLIKEIFLLEKNVRNHINTSRYQIELIKDLDDWNQICSSLDSIGDTLVCVEAYLETEYPNEVGLKYLNTYGVLQALFIQQDAIKDLSNKFNLEYEAGETLLSIRRIRNASVGHPTNNNEKKVKHSNFISRPSLSKEGFTLHRSSKKNRMEFIEVNLIKIINNQLFEIEKKYKYISNKLIEVDKMHKEKYKNKLLSDVFHSSMGYQFEKISQGIVHDGYGYRDFGKNMLDSIESTYKEFKKLLIERNELNEYIEYELKEYFFAIDELNTWFRENNENVLQANIYLYFIRENHKSFIEIAKEIDEEYNINPKD